MPRKIDRVVFCKELLQAEKMEISSMEARQQMEMAEEDRPIREERTPVGPGRPAAQALLRRAGMEISPVGQAVEIQV
jgi:predicted ArsR family transcriptional regulator